MRGLTKKEKNKKIKSHSVSQKIRGLKKERKKNQEPFSKSKNEGLT